MKEITFSKAILGLKTLDYTPGLNYLFPEGDYDFIKEYERSYGDIILSIGRWPDALRNWTPESSAKTLLVYNTGGTGDRLWTTWLVDRIAKINPELQIDVVARGQNANLWWRNSNIRSVRIAPIQVELLDNYESWLLFDENRYGGTFCNGYKILCELSGIEYLEIDLPKPVLRLFKQDEDIAFTKLGINDENNLPVHTQGHIVLALHSRSQTKDLHPVQIEQLLYNLNVWRGSAENVSIYGISNNDFGTTVQRKLTAMKIKNYIPVHNLLNLREIAVLCYYAGIVISPDSMLVHLAASQNAPTVAMMSTFDPKDINGMYPLCEPIWKQSACSFAPCEWRYQNFIYQIGDNCKVAPCWTPRRNMCSVAASISVSDILQAADRAINKKLEFDGYKTKLLTAQ